MILHAGAERWSSLATFRHLCLDHPTCLTFHFTGHAITLDV